MPAGGGSQNPILIYECSQAVTDMTSAKGHPVWPLITLGPQNLSWSFCTPFFLDPCGNFLSLMFWVTWKHGAIIWRMQIHTSSLNANKPIILSDLVWMLKNSGIFFLKMCTRYHIKKIEIISWKIHLFPKRIIQTWQTKGSHPLPKRMNFYTLCKRPLTPPPSVLHDHVAIFSTWMLKSA